jgi:hypothetical protein
MNAELRQRATLRAAAALWILAVLAVLAHTWLRPHTNTLYKVFHDGGARWMASQDLYPKVGEFIYSPFAAAFFSPFTLLPDRVAGILWRFITIGTYCGAFAAWLGYVRAAGNNVRASAGLMGAAWLLLLPLSVGDMFNGQASPMVIGLQMLAVLACRREQWMAAALCVGVAAYFKVYPLAIGLLLCMLHPRKLPWRLALAIAGIFGFTLILKGPAYGLQQFSNWLHSLGLDPRRTQGYFGAFRDFWLILRVLRVPIDPRGWTVLQCLAGLALAAWLWLEKRRGATAERLDYLLLALGTCWMLLFGPATESATYVILAPSLSLAFLRWRGTKYLAGAIACYALLIASQMLSSWGHQHQNAYTHLVQPVGTLIFAVTLLISRE